MREQICGVGTQLPDDYPSIYTFSVGSERQFLCPAGSVDWIFINVNLSQTFCAEPMRERLTFHFGLGLEVLTSVFFFFSSFLSFCFFKSRQDLVL